MIVKSTMNKIQPGILCTFKTAQNQYGLNSSSRTM